MSSWDPAVATAPSSKSVAGYSILPIGAIELSASPRNPLGYYICNGDTYTKSGNPDLWFAIGDSYSQGGADITDFIVPNMSYNFPMGQPLIQKTDTGPGGIQIGTTTVNGGTSTVILNVSNIPPHAHPSLTVQNGMGSSSGGIGTAQPVGTANPGAIIGADIYDGNGNLITSSGNTAQPFNIQNPYTGVQYLIRSTYAIPETSVVGRVNIDTTNNQFYVAWGSNTATVATLNPGAYTFLQMLNEFARAIIAQTSPDYFLNAYTIDPFGNYVARIHAPSNPGISINFSQDGDTTISNSVLDKCADTLGFITRSINAVNIVYDDCIISPYKAMKCNWNGSIADGTLNASDFTYISNW